jgi:aspartate aminotransferase-like enzyme
MPDEHLLLTPGPTPVPPEVLRALAQPVIHHRSPDFTAVFETVLERLAAVFRTSGDVLVLTASGTGAFESAFVNLLSPGERVLVVSCGEFGTRWQAMGRALGLDVAPLDYPWGETPRPEDVEARLRETGAAVAVVVHSETSTGDVCDLRALLDTCRRSGALSIVDAISSLGAVPLETDEWGADVVVTGSQKTLMTPPGLSFVAISERAWATSETAALPRFYWDWAALRKAQAKGSTRFTPATSTVVALAEALRLLLADGLETAFARHVAIGRACRAGVKALGLELYSPDEDRAAVLTAVLTPPGVDAVALRLALRDRHGITIAGGHGDLVPRLFRIGHIGYVGIEQISTALAAIEQELSASIEIEPGAAVAAARAAYGTAAAA